MWISTDKSLSINDALIATGRVTHDLGVLVSLNNTAVTVPAGPDADSLAALLGLDNTVVPGSAESVAKYPPPEKKDAPKSVHHDTVTHQGTPAKK